LNSKFIPEFFFLLKRLLLDEDDASIILGILAIESLTFFEELPDLLESLLVFLFGVKGLVFLPSELFLLFAILKILKNLK
jgi:hypothetical protein